MRHRVKGRKLGRTASHRLSTLRLMATSLLLHKKIKTTLAKAKTCRSFVEPLITKAKEDTVHARRLVARHIQDNTVVQELFTEIVPKIGDRPGGYTRIVKLGQRRGDAAEMAILELVDYNELMVKKAKKDASDKKEAKEKVKGKDEVIEDAQVIEEKPKAKKTTAAKKTDKPAKKTTAKKETKEKAEKKTSAKKETKAAKKSDKKK